MHQDYQALLSQNGLASLHDVFAYDPGEKRVKPHSETPQSLRVELTDENQEPIVFLIKRYGPCKPRLFSKKSMATAGYDFKAAMELAEKGSVVARPIAYGVETQGRSEKRSFVIFEQRPPSHSTLGE